MIKIQSLIIEEFRGIRKLKLDPEGRNFAIYGPNGTGKSGVVDAIEFVLTGNISRLTGQGTSNISLKSHAPHVDQRNAPDRARVVLQGYVPSLNRALTIERHVSNPGTPIITPDDADARKIVAELALHPEFALTRREIIKYVIAAPGERSKEVQALLRLDDIEKVRQSLQTVLNSAKSATKNAEQDANQAQLQLLRALGIAALKRDELLAAVNKRRQLLGLESLLELGPSSSLKTGLTGGTGAAKSAIPKKQAVSDVSAFIARLAANEPEILAAQRKEVELRLKQLLDSASLLRSLRREAFLRSGLELIEEEMCPFCDQQWDMGELRRKVKAKLSDAEEALRLKDGIAKLAAPIVQELRDMEESGRGAIGYAKQLATLPRVEALTEWVEATRKRRERLASLENIGEALDALLADVGTHSAIVVEELSGIRQQLIGLPEVSQEDEAKEYLTVAQERLDVYREKKRQQNRAAKQQELATKVMSAFSASSEAVLTGIYKDVEQDFSRFYQLMHKEDEATFSGKLIPSLGKLGFDVDFYGRGYFPPGAYHSEGHQDSMGICLYLALMRHTLSAQFTFAVLDDVVMSVDSRHRREICALLKSQFPDTQFIITTHDEIWLNHMKTEKLVASKSSVQFRKWTVDDGPVIWEGKEVWQEIQDDLDDNNVPAAAQTLRRYLEYVAAQLCSKLRAPLEYRADAQHDLGELLPAVVGRWRSLLSRAQESAQSWNNKEETSRLSQRQKDFAQKVETTNVEQWSVNKSIHFNEWATLGKQDFLPVVKAFQELLDAFRCSTCDVFIYVIPPKGSMENLRCDCGAVNINLKRRT